MPNVSEFRRAIKLLQGIRAHVAEDATVKQVITLLTIATEAGIDQTTLGAKTNIGRSTTSKNIADLSLINSRKQPGPALVENTLDPMRLQIRLPRLTKKGELVLQRLAAETWGS